jgi:limonene-1,2-epoxide hydrolase
MAALENACESTGRALQVNCKWWLCKTPAMTAEETVNEFIRRVVAMYLDGAAELVSDDLEYDNVPLGKNHGPEGLKTFLGAMVSGFEEVEFVIHRQTVTGNTVMNERTDRFRAGDKWIDLPVAGVFEVDTTGKIALWRDYFDMATFTNQM